jgi:transposase
MADKSHFVDMISEATRQRTRRAMPRVIEPAAKEASRLSHWPPQRWADWRTEKLTPWKLKPWKIED